MITKEQVLAAQNKWGTGVVTIGTLKNKRTDCEIFTRKFLNELYAFDNGPVLFKPTKCAIQQFRSTIEEALSYFIAGDNCACKEDNGFAIEPWREVKFENNGIILASERAIAMGNYYFSDFDGNDVKVEYTFGYKLLNGNLKIDLHHSSFPYKH